MDTFFVERSLNHWMVGCGIWFWRDPPSVSCLARIYRVRTPFNQIGHALRNGALATLC